MAKTRNAPAMPVKSQAHPMSATMAGPTKGKAYHAGLSPATVQS